MNTNYKSAVCFTNKTLILVETFVLINSMLNFKYIAGGETNFRCRTLQSSTSDSSCLHVICTSTHLVLIVLNRIKIPCVEIYFLENIYYHT